MDQNKAVTTSVAIVNDDLCKGISSDMRHQFRLRRIGGNIRFRGTSSGSGSINKILSSWPSTPPYPSPSSSSSSSFSSPHFLNMTLYTDQCHTQVGSKSYITPVDECYNGKTLFPNNDPSWTDHDYYDTVICQTIVRTIFQNSYNGTCTPSSSSSSSDDDDDDDRFLIPMNVCVGPFGRPRPWGIFEEVPQQ